MENVTETSSNSSTTDHQYEYEDKHYYDYYDEPLYRLQDDVSSTYGDGDVVKLNYFLSDWGGGAAGRGLLRHLPHSRPGQLHRHLHCPHQPPDAVCDQLLHCQLGPGGRHHRTAGDSFPVPGRLPTDLDLARFSLFLLSIFPGKGRNFPPSLQ